MSIKVELKGRKLITETDYAGSDVDHSLIQSDRSLIGAMRSFGITKVEGSKSGGTHSLHEDFDRQIKEKYGRDQGYFSPL